MENGSERLDEAVGSLRRAADADFSGNHYYQVSNAIAGLIELTNSNPQKSLVGGQAVTHFYQALAGLRKAIDSELSGNRFYLAFKKLDELTSLAIVFKQNSVPASQDSKRERTILSLSANGPALAAKDSVRSFDDLAAEAKSRVDMVAASLGIAPRHSTAPMPSAATPETLADGELERRSSEPCSMAELAPPLAAVEAPSFHAQGASQDTGGSEADDLGSPPVEVESGPAHGENSSSPPEETGIEPAIQAATPAHDPAPASAGRKVEGKPAEEKTLFTLWLDIMFGRKR